MIKMTKTINSFKKDSSVNNKKRYTKAYEAWCTLFITEIITIPLTKVLGKCRVNPNVITILSLLAGAVTLFFFATGHWVLGVIFFHLSNFLDCLDGKVARYRGMTSAFGAKLDVLGDYVKKPSSFLGVGIYFLSTHQILFGILTGVALVAQFCTHKAYLLLGVSEYDLEFPRFHRKVIRRIAPRMLNLYTFFEEQFLEFGVFPLIGGIIGLPEGGVWFLYGALFTFCLGLLKLANSLNYRRKGRYDEIYQDWAGTGGNLDKV